jgi:hypothetical protein
MRTILSGLLACGLFGVATVSVFAQPQPPQAPRPGTIDAVEPKLAPELGAMPPLPQVRGRGNNLDEAVGFSGILVPTVSRIPDKEVVGLAPGSRLDILTWERAYALALVRVRDSRGGLAEALDPKALDEQAARLGVADFDRFRKDFLAARPGAGGTFRDPSGDDLDLLRRLQMIDNARRNVAFHENLSKLLAELIQGEAGGLSQFDLDMVFAALLRGRQSLSDEIGQFRDKLDEVKVALGLSPHAPVIPDRRSLNALATAFDAVENWSKNPDRNLNELHKLTQKLPALGEVVVDGHPILGTVEANPEPSEDVLANAVRLAIANRGGPDKGQLAGDGDVRLELSVRRRIRHLFETRRAYEGEKRSYERAIRIKDQSFERMISPSPASVSGRSPKLDGLLEAVAQIRRIEDRLVTLWTSFRAERLALYRELGVLPYADWASFYKDLSAE